MRRHRNGKNGFSLIEVLLVLAILGIISTIAIPSYLGQRRRARVIGDAQTNAQVLRMALETRKAENGVYGTTGTYTWTNGTPSNSTFLPSFTPKGNSKMNFSLLLGSTGLTYTLTVQDPTVGGATILTTTQTGSTTIAAY
ncbi:type IV pilin protein [Holophaga foetida]|uniref:type IV pilin protein n=1 Tax=Holophaga foetida TaxID=35839 RepID=UPI0002474257|nr:type II secretion system protein [Holophaga foetida]